METKDYFFVISVPRDEMLEFTSKLNSYISRVFPDKKNPFTMKPLEIGETDALAKVIINTTEHEIREFAQRFFGGNYMLIEREKGEVEITQTDESHPAPEPDETVIKH